MKTRNLLHMLLCNTAGYSAAHSVRLVRLQAAITYMRGLQALRLVALSFVGLAAALTFIGSALIIMHLMILMYAPWSLQARIIFTVGGAVIYITAGTFYLIYLFSQQRWMKILKGDAVLAHIAP